MKPTSDSEPILIGKRIDAIQRRKSAIVTEMTTLGKRLDKLGSEVSELGTEHQQLLRRFDAVAVLK